MSEPIKVEKPDEVANAAQHCCDQIRSPSGIAGPISEGITQLKGEIDRLGRDIELYDGVFRMIAAQLKALGCCHNESAHDNTPLMMYDDWIRCVVRKRELEIQRLTLIEQATKTYIEICDGTESALVTMLVTMAAFDDLKEAVEPATENDPHAIVRKELLALGCRVSDCKECGYPVINKRRLCRVCLGEMTERERAELDDRLATEKTT